MISTSACAKIILLGEHAVVYGQPAIAVPISSVRVNVVAESHHQFEIVARNLNNQVMIASDYHNPFIQLVVNICHLFKQPLPLFRFYIDSQIPIASGLGSGAAISTALARAVFETLQQPYQNEQLNEIVYETEKFYHGTPSGIDNSVIVYEKPVYFVRNEPLQIISYFRPFSIIVANTGIAAPTKEAVSDVRALYNSNSQEYDAVFAKIGDISQRGLLAMQTGDWQSLGGLMNEDHALLQKLTVSSLELDTLVSEALKNGALGAKLSGGGRGGNMIVLVEGIDAVKIKTALSAAGAVHVFETRVYPQV